MSKNTPHEEFDDERDAAALEYLIEAGFDRSCIERLPAALRANAERLLGELDAIDRYPVEPPSELLVEATLARVARADEQSRERWRLPQWNAPRSRWGLPNLVAIAALLIVAAGVAIPVTAQVRRSHSQSLCANSLRGLGGGLAAYAADHRGMLPMTAGLASFLGGSSEQEPSMAENARHLELLSSKGYCDANCTRCNGARDLSYRVPTHRSQLQLAATTRSPVAADANPVQSLVQRGFMPPTFDLNSPNHGQSGQNVLFSDGSAVWLASPRIQVAPNGWTDNIWVIRGRDGGETIDFRRAGPSALEILLVN
jgi:hypothetical protein